jgi:predicted nucleic acid-binding protein
MSERKGLVLDANILLRAVFGRRVLQILESYEDEARFYTPDICFEDAQRYIPVISNERGLDADLGMSVLDQLARIVEQVDRSLYEEYQSAARERISVRDPDDWPVVATALLLNLPIWTEDPDFFGSGVATWTSDRVELYLREQL